MVTSSKVGRTRHHYLTGGPIRGMHDRWVNRYRIRAADLLDDLRISLEADTMPTPDIAAAGVAAPQHVVATFIRATPEKIWQALTTSEFTTRYWYGSTISSDWFVGSTYELRTHDD